MLDMIISTPATSDELQLSKVVIKDDYRKKWNIHENDFVFLTIGERLLRNTLYRVGGMGGNIKDNYFMLLRHVEAYYKDSITKDKSKKPHLESQWCIVDKNGEEKVSFEAFKTPYLVRNSCIYSINNAYYNIETNEHYCDSYSSMSSTDFLFLENKFDKDKSKRGIMKINKEDGSWELFK